MKDVFFSFLLDFGGMIKVGGGEMGLIAIFPIHTSWPHKAWAWISG